MRNKNFKSKMILIIFIFLYLFSGCFDFIGDFNRDPVLLRASPYIDKIEIDNSSLRNYAYLIIQDCQMKDKECVINKIYRYIIENFVYIEDPVNDELIKSPFETINDGGGDCEDLSILLNSLLENIGIKTFLVMNETHAYSLVYDVNSSIMWHEIENSFISHVEVKWGEKIRQEYIDSITLNTNGLWYYGGDGSYLNEYIEYLNISYDINSDKPIDLYVVPSRSDFENLSDNKDFNYYEDFNEVDILSIKDQLSFADRFGGIILHNKNKRFSKIDFNISFYFHPSFYEYYKNFSIKEYDIEDKKCIALDCTVGEWGYPGYDGGIKGKKIAISSTTKEYFYLD